MLRRVVWNPYNETDGFTHDFNVYIRHFIPWGQREEGSGMKSGGMGGHTYCINIMKIIWLTLYKHKRCLLEQLHNRTKNIKYYGGDTFWKSNIQVRKLTF